MIPQVQAPLPVSLHSHEGSVLRLPDMDRDYWLQSALSLQYPDYRDVDAWAEFRAISRRLADQHLTWEIHEGLRGFFTPVGVPYLIVENLPIDPHLPPFPLDGMRPTGKQGVSEAVIAGLIGDRAEIFSYANEKAGSPIHEIAPVPGLELTQSNAGRTPMEYHTDGAFLPARFRPKGLLLLGLLNVDTDTLIMPAEQLMDAASPALLDALSKPWYRHARPASFSVDAIPNPGPILWRGPYGYACVAAASSAIEPLNAPAHEALSKFRQVCARLTPARISIAPGTALLFRNDRVLHGRNAVSGSRWLQRAYFADALEPFRTATNADPRAFCFDAESLLQLCD
jgi:L-asparagine oxygenase